VSQLPVRLGVCLLPDLRWADALAEWTRLDDLGVDHLWTYDHLSWRDLRDGPWLGAVPLLAAMAARTSRSLLGTLVASPNYRHPVTFAKEALTLAEISDDRFVCGVGAGGTGWDATVLGQELWSRAERTDRFVEFTELLAELVSTARTTRHGSFYSAVEATMIPVRTVPLAIAATGERGLDLAARSGSWWITFGHPTSVGEMTNDECVTEIERQLDGLQRACDAHGRDRASIRRAMLVGSSTEPWTRSAEDFVDLCRTYADLGITDVIIHAPRSSPPHVYDRAVYEEILTLR
jgi:alkanesulfonate monooxygenase SsuD/methylene tetrahydromethanopterin reductase-like flavin-dependent oxidoreductase (luciferase family)